MTTIVTKNGSGAPLASDLVQGELAVDLTNKRLYTEDSGGTVIEIGTSPSTIDINAGTIDGTVIGGASAAAGTFTTFTSTGIDDNATSTAITIDSSQNVGIGETSPSTPLEVKGSSGFVATLNATVANGASIAFEASGTNVGYVGGSGAFNSSASAGDFGLRSASNMTFSTNNDNERMRIDSSGNVGIGTASPTVKTQIVGSGAIFRISDDVSTSGTVDISASSSEAVINANTYASAVPLVFKNASTERMRIDSSGNLLVGQTSQTYSLCRLEAANATSEGVRLSVTDIARSGAGYPVIGYNCGATTTVNTYNRYVNDYSSWIHFDAGQIETFTSTAVGTGNFSGVQGPYVARGGTSWTSSSDSRLKSNVKDVEYGLETVLQLEPKIYERLDRDNAIELGFIAQDVEKVIPEVVVPPVENSKYYGINYERIIPVLTKAIQEQQAMIEELKAEVAAQRAELSALKGA